MGTPNSDRVELYAGDDTASGRAGSDEVACGDGNNDTIYLSGRDHFGHNIDSSCENVVSY